MPHSWVDHTSEVELCVEAPSEEGVFTAALEAIGELLAEDPSGEPVRREVELESADRATLLADWLGELVYLADTDGFLVDRVEHLELDGIRLRATLAGRPARRRNLVKAVTYHGLELAAVDAGWRGRVVLDV